ncbi:MAG TPA: M36 family metallopeptidase, partial [Tepidisphaeraceae bacterium]|nr:M36 family metallopeptidase [Tepidisphaeraceae bacterium]
MKQTKTTAKAASRFSLRADRVAPRRRAVVAAARRIVEHLETRTLLSAATANTDTPLPEPYLPPQHDLLDLTGGYLSAPSSGAPLTIARNYLASHAASLGVSAADLGSSVVSDQYTDADTGTTHIYLTQTFDGLPVANANLVVNVTAHGQVLNVAGGFVNGLAAAQGSGTQNGPVQLVTSASTPTISAVQALQDATADLGLSLSAQPTLVQSSSPVDMGYGADETGTLTAPGVSSSDVPAGLQYIWTPDGVRLSWDLQIQTTDQAHWYDVSVGATAVGSTGAGDLVFANDWVDHANYNVMALPNESANEGTRSVLTDPNDPTMSPYGWHDTNGVTGPEYTITRGNNVFAYTDTANANVPGFSPDGGASLNFDYPWDTTQSPSTTSNQSAAVTNLFYLNNTLHDIHARYGFTEAAGNFQVMNYSGQGVGNDPVLAEAQDGGGTNNANFATPVDGSSPRMQMYLWTYSTPSRDGDFDNGIVVHEYGHGVSNRLTGGPANSNALSALQSGGMGEGWSDWWALMLTQRPTDLQNSAYPMGTWALNQAATGAGIRRYPYSYNTSIDPETFGLYGGANGTEVHNTGELWSTALWDMNWLLIQKYGFGTNVAGGYDPNTTGKNGGNNLALKLVMDGLKLQPANPSFVDARNAIIAADQALNGGQDLFQIWSAFARRGLGYSAVDSSSSATTITTATDLPVGLLNPRVTAQSPTGAQTTPLSSIDFTFSKAMDPTSFSVAADVASFTGPGAVDLKSAITGFSWINSNTTLHVTFSAQSTNGVYKMVIGPQILAGDNASPMDQDGDGTAGEPTQDQYTATFGFESQFLQVASTTPANGSLVSLPFTTLDVKFNEPYDPATLGASDLTLSQGTVTNAAVVDSTTARFTLSGITNEGTLTVAIAAGALSDTDGFGMLAYSGSFATDIGTRAMPATTTLAPRGSMVYQSATSGIIGTTADTDSFTMSLDPGQTLSLVLHPTTAQLRPSMQLYSPANVLLGTITAAAANQDAVIQSAPVAAAGTYTIVVASDGATSGSYALTAMLNAAVEAEEHNGPSNDTIATAENMDSAFRVMAPGGPTIGSVVGNLATSATDFYAVSLTAGQTVSFAVAMQSGTGTPALSLSNAAGTSLASGVSTITNVQSGIANYVVPTTAVYYLKVTGSNVAYTLLATENAAFDFESNGTIATAQPVGGSRAVAGAVGSGIVGNVKVGLIQDQLPWGSSSDTTVATGLGYSVTVISSASLATANLSAYDMIVLSGQQTSATYNTVQTNLSRIRSFVVAGGVYIANYAAYSTDNAYSYSVLPDAASGTFTYLGGSDINVLAPSSPLVNGPGGTITDTTLDGGNYSFHGYTTVVPSGATTVLSGPSASQIVAFDYPDGAGHVIVDTIPIEFYGGTGNFGIFHKNLFAYGGSFKPTNDDDYYAVTLAAGQTVQLGTSTPGDGAGEPGNTLDPAIAIYDAGGNTLGADDNGGADGRNAHLSYTAATAGTYYVRVYPSPNSTTSGEYVLNLFDKALTTTLPVSAQETAGAINGTLSVATAPTSDLVVTLTSSDSARVSVPSTLTIPAGQTSVPLPITVLDNSLLDGLEQVTIAAVAGGYSSGNSVITIHDDETATLSVTLPSTAREGDGVIVGTVTASAAPTRDIVVALSSDTLSKLSVPASVVIKAGQLSATFNATVIDNTVIDGALNATVTAAVDNWTTGSSTIAVADNDAFITVTMPTSG